MRKGAALARTSTKQMAVGRLVKLYKTFNNARLTKEFPFGSYQGRDD